MIAVLIPFFLTAHFATDSSWYYGPQYTFLIKVNIMINNKENPINSKTMTLRLVCRPKEFNSLRCQLNSIESESLMSRLENVPFDIIFNNKGIHSFFVSDTLSDDRLVNSLKYVSNLLSVGADLTNRPDEVFKEPESFLQGKCETYFDVSHWPLLNESDHENYILNSLPSLNKVVGEAIRVEKNRDLRNCEQNTRFNFLLSSVTTTGFVEKILDTNLSWNLITVTDTNFESSAEVKALINSDQSHNSVEITEKIFLYLESITPATEKLESFENSVKSSVLGANVEMN